MPHAKMRFKLLKGSFKTAKLDDKGNRILIAGANGAKRSVGQMFKKGDIIESTTNLTKRFGRNKFEPLGHYADTGEEPLGDHTIPGDSPREGAPESMPTADNDPDGELAELHAMTVADLKELAESEETDLAGATKKEDIITAIVKHRHA